MKFKYIGKNATDEHGNEQPVNSYGGQKVLNGESVELDGFFAEKAMKNPSYQQVKPRGKSAARKAFEDS